MVFRKSFDVLNYLVFTLFMLACIYPFYYILVYSLSNPAVANHSLILFPVDLTLRNYVEVAQLPGIAWGFLISAARAVIGTLITVFCCSLFAFVLTKPEMYYRRTIYRFVVLTLYLNAGLIPWYLTMKAYGFQNSFLLYVIPSAVNAFFVILIKTFIEQLPQELEESAMIDGPGLPGTSLAWTP